MRLTRRNVVGLLTAGAAASCMETPDLPTGPIAGAPFEPGRLPSQDVVWSWVETINGFGPRLTGSLAQARCVDFVAAELERAGLTAMRDPRPLRRWEAKRWELTLAGTPGETLQVASPFPYSGRTPTEGISGELAWYSGPPLSFERARGRIAVVEVAAPPLSPLLQHLVMGEVAAVPADAAVRAAERTPLIGGLVGVVDLRRAAAADVLGVACVWHGCAEADIRDQYLPFTTPYAGCPALWVGPEAGERLRGAAQRGERATLVLEAELDDRASTDTIYAVLPGSDPSETMLVNTHSDGPNAAEENGAAGVLALARYFASLPREARRRTLVFVVATGHFQLPQLGNGGQATKAWLDDHRDLWDGTEGRRRAVAGVTLEHLGCLEWKENGGNYGPTGRLERELVYATNATMRRAYVGALGGRTKLRALVAEPRNGVFFGEGEPFFNAGIPSISACPLPNYLCAMPADGGLLRLDPAFMHQQIATFAKALLQLDALPARTIGPVQGDPTAFLGHSLKAILDRSF